MFFEIENDYKYEDGKKSLTNIIKNKRILIIGGIPEWRKKIKKKYDELLTLDGLKPNFDIRTLKNIDYIFFNVGSMNHATYYRVINYIRTNSIPFGYIGRTNTELIESEMIRELENIWD